MGNNEKIKKLEELAEILAKLHREDGSKTVHCHGVFDLLHIGHIRHFRQAKEMGDLLVVTLTPDRYVNKGPHRPAFREELRAEAIAALDCVDYVALNQWPTAVETIKLLKPHFYAKGDEYSDARNDLTGKIVDEEEAVRSVGGQIVFTNDIVYSSSNLINKYMPSFPPEAAKYLAEFRRKFSSEQVVRYLKEARSLRVLLVGEAIIDEYHYCETIGKSGKEPIIAARFLSEEKSAGGVLAAANHAASFSDNLGVLTFLGSEDSQEDFIREHLDPKVDRMFLYLDDSPTIVKRRLVESYPFQKLFEIYVMGHGEHTPTQDRALCDKLSEVLPEYDVVIVTDYGHGMIGPEATELLCDKARFLAVNTQANAHNHGFNTVSKYRRADFVSVSQRELQLEVRSRTRDLEEVMTEVAEKLSLRQMVITRGQEGCVCYSREDGIMRVPAFTTHVVDRIGAGDALFAVTALVVAQDAPAEVAGFIACAVGSQAVGVVGNRTCIKRVPLCKHIESMLK